jgi:single-stranded-DNA-specific exonuclease
MEQDLTISARLAEALETHNRQRRAIEKSTLSEVLKEVETTFNPDQHRVIVVGKPGWHIGVVGIVAARVLKKYYRPVIIAGGDGEDLRGSGRSIPGFDLAAALRECGDILLRHGGHAMAAGVSVSGHHLDLLRERLNDCAGRTLEAHHLECPLTLDAEVTLAELNAGSLETLNRLAPFGQGNPVPKFFTRRLSHARPLQKIGSDKKHVKMWVTDGTATHEAVWWGAGNASLPVGQFEMAYEPRLNSYNGRTCVQLTTCDWREPAVESLC